MFIVFESIFLLFSFIGFSLFAARNHALGKAVFGTLELEQLLVAEYFGEFFEIDFLLLQNKQILCYNANNGIRSLYYESE